MKDYYLISLIILMTISCRKSIPEEQIESREILSEWKYVAYYASDGSPGDWTTYEGEDLILKIETENIISLNHTICTIPVLPNDSWITIEYDDQYFYPSCYTPPTILQANYSITNNELILNYICNEGCFAKYIKIEN